ncbi:MAG: iron hydrogenase, partial [Ignavibacteriales bacterium]
MKTNPELLINNNKKRGGPVLFSRYQPGEGIYKALEIGRENILFEVKTSGLKGRGGAGFPTGTKWMFTAAAISDTKYIICNADEGEPGTFKDRILLLEYPELVFEGMVIAGFAIGAALGI